MKLTGYILAFYLILLSVVPCCSFDSCPDDKVATEQADQHESGDKDCGACSPFFNCEGCAPATINVNTSSFAILSPEVKRVYTGFIPSFIPNVHYDFWQPPRLG
jgi:hypothetical protein